MISATQAITAAQWAGWIFSYLDDGYGEPGWWAYKGDQDRPTQEVGLFDNLEDAAFAATGH